MPEPDRAFASADLAEILAWYDERARVRMSARLPATSSGPCVDARQIGEIRVARSHVPDDLTITAAETDVYAIATVHTGAVQVEEDRRSWLLTPAVAGFYRPPRAPRHNHIAAGTDMTFLLIARHEVERQLEHLIEQYVPGPVDFGPELPLHGRPAWLRPFLAFADVFTDPDSAVHRPMINEPLREAMINALLYAADHPYQAVLRRTATPARPRYLRVAVEAMETEPEIAWTVAGLAGTAGVGVRALQQGFRDRIGMPPMAYLRRVRLARVHDDLRRGDGSTVAEIAYRWGFSHLGRFAADYAAVYGVPPSATRSRSR